MQTKRWLLPCTHAVDVQAIDAALQAAEQCAATLVVLSLVAPFQERWEKPGQDASFQNTQQLRLEQLQEAQDFLEAVRWKAHHYQVMVESHQVFTQDVPTSIAAQCKELGCQSIILMRQSTRQILLSAQSVKHLLLQPPAALLVLTLPTVTKQERRFPRVLHHFFGRQEKATRGQVVGEEASTCQIDTLAERQWG